MRRTRTGAPRKQGIHIGTWVMRARLILANRTSRPPMRPPSESHHAAIAPPEEHS